MTETRPSSTDDYAPKGGAMAGGIGRGLRVSESRLGVQAGRVAMLTVAVAATLLEHGAYRPVVQPMVAFAIQGGLFVAYACDVWLGAWRGRIALRGVKPGGFDLTMLIVAVTMMALSGIALGLDLPARIPWYGFELTVFTLLITDVWRLQVAVSRRLNQPGLLLPLSFALLVLTGTILLSLPRAVPTGQHLSPIDALFTITSAVCVTGLIVRDTATQFTPFGQAVIAIFIQLGGLGIMVFGSVLAMLMGAGFSIRDRTNLSSMLNDQPLSRITSYVGFVVITTLGIELAGAALMYSLWNPSVGWEERIALSLFHSVSAFCNAGFSLFSNSLEGYRYSAVTHLVIMPLIVLGGLGFPVLENGFRVARWRWRRWSDRSQGLLRRSGGELSEHRLSLHTKLVLATTAGLYFAGIFGFAAAQLSPRIYAWSQQGSAAHAVAAKPLTAGDCAGVLADSSFMSITARTAGFNSVPMQEIKPAGRFTLMALMMVGASPGGTGGGMKTTTLALIVLAIAAAVRQRARVELFHRTLTDDLIRAAATLSMAFTAVVALGTFLLCLSETASFEKILFETISAASTTGLSLGLTPDLTTFGKLVIIVLMFLGRVGPLALLGALLIRRQVSQGYIYPREAILMG